LGLSRWDLGVNSDMFNEGPEKNDFEIDSSFSVPLSCGRLS